MKQHFNILSLVIFFLCPSLQAQSLEPGFWKAKSAFKVNGIALPPSNTDGCVSSEEAKDAKATIAKELKKNGCDLTSWVVKNSRLEAALTCHTETLDAKGTLRGTFSAKSYTLNGEAEGTIQNMIPSKATLQLSGLWVKACIK